MNNIFTSSHIRWARKPIRWGEANHYVAPRDVTDAVRDLPRYSGPSHPYMDFHEERPQFFVVDRDGKEYLVDTQGYNYARYVVRLLGEDER